MIKTNPDMQKYMDKILSLKQEQVMSLGSELEERAAKLADNAAIIYQDQTISYGELNGMSNRYAHFFQAQGFKKGDVVALLMENRPEYLMAVIGLSKLGVIVSLINTVIRGERLAHAINISEARAVIIGHEMIDVYNSIINGVRLKSPAKVLVETQGLAINIPNGMESLNALLEPLSTNNPETTSSVSSEDVFIYMETAGSSGLRKAVAIPHKRWLIMGCQFTMVGEMNPDSVLYMCVPLYYNMGLNVCFSSMIISGCTMVIRKKFSVSNFWPEINKYKVSHFNAVGEMLRYIADQPVKPDDGENPLKYVLVNSVRGDQTIPWYQRFGIKRFTEVYGTTEGVGTFINEAEISGMCGNLNFRALRQGEVVAYDSENEQILRGEDGWAVKCMPGQSGVLIGEINELNKFLGYVNEPEATEAKIIRNVFLPGDQYYNTGDILQLHDGDDISFVDRTGDTYRWKSKTVSAIQVGDVLNKFFGGIDEAYVYGVKMPGMEGRCGMAVLVLLEDVPLDWKGLVDHINRRMPQHARPVFIRICEEIDFKRMKSKLQKEGFDPSLIKDPLYFFDPEKNAYLQLTMEKYEDIVAGRIRL
ncbi:MAG: long-chain-acyl-CoA synthetase [Syntrophomonadaceae bacterium]|nr:long-chain-acyl-CoA synthetase [Syntrophomonadaceae bacterium]